MDFLGIGMEEVLLILLVALIIWGPARIAEMGRTLGKATRSLRKASSDLTAQIARELERAEKEHPPEEKRKIED